MNNNKLSLSEAEKKFLFRFKKYIDKIYINYISVGLSLCVALVGLIVGIELDSKAGFLIAIIFSAIGVNFFLLSRSYQKLYAIISKMERYIKKIEDFRDEDFRDVH